MTDLLSTANPIEHQRYRELPEAMFAINAPDLPPMPKLIALNHSLLNEYGISADWFESDAGLAILSGQTVNDNNGPIAMAYSGHQFGGWVPVLGDGRAHMLGQLKLANDTLVDVQLKGSGRTDYSRGGDGFATLGAVMREFLISEAMAGLNIATSRSLAMIGTGNQVYRERIYPGAILVRTATSHMRVGTFQFASSNLGPDAVRKLADFVIKHHYPSLADSTTPYLDLLAEVAKGQGRLIAQWMLVGFVHGVMNTDNSSIVSETFDYGPCAFVDEFHPQKVFSSIDHYGRYAWNQQPSMAYWNLSRLAETLLPILGDNEDTAIELAKERLEEFVTSFRTAFDRGLERKLGLTADVSAKDVVDGSTEGEQAPGFAQQSLSILTKNKADFTLFFDRLTQIAETPNNSDAVESFAELFISGQDATDWLEQWRSARAESNNNDGHDNNLSHSNGDDNHYDSGSVDAMRAANPAVIARNHRVEQAINAAVNESDFEPFERLCRALSNPYRVDAQDEDLKAPPQSGEQVSVTYCGT